MIGKSHEGGVPFESIVKRVVIYVMKEYKNGKDLTMVIEKQVDDFEKASRTKEPEIDEKDHTNPAKMLCCGKWIDIYLKEKKSTKIWFGLWTVHTNDDCRCKITARLLGER